MRLYDVDKDHEESVCLVSNVCLITSLRYYPMYSTCLDMQTQESGIVLP